MKLKLQDLEIKKILTSVLRFASGVADMFINMTSHFTDSQTFNH